MPDHPKRGTLAQLAALDPETGEVTVVIETPKGSRNKYSYDEECGAFRLKHVLPEGMNFPHDFGFIPSTKGEDGDPLDVLVLLDAPAVAGCVLTARLLGVIEAEQQAGEKAPVRNDRLIAAATQAHTHAHMRSLDDLPPYLLGEVESFFTQYNRLRHMQFRTLGRGGPERASALVEKGMAAFGSNE